jgi:hypothetical protein
MTGLAIDPFAGGDGMVLRQGYLSLVQLLRSVLYQG